MDGWRGLWHGMPNMNTLVGLGTVSAYLASCVALLFPQLGWECFFDEPVMLLGFILLGRTLEAKARGRASAALEALAALQPQVARLIGASQRFGTSRNSYPCGTSAGWGVGKSVTWRKNPCGWGGSGRSNLGR